MKVCLAAALGSLAVASVVALLAIDTAVAAGPIYKNFTTLPFSEEDVSCSGEPVVVSGIVRHHAIFVMDAHGGFHGTSHFNGYATGVSSSGTRYVVNFTDGLRQYFAPGDVPSVGTGPFSFRLISNDGSPNLLVRGAFHITVNANGEVTVFVEDVRIECPGGST
jgi:hypothetical protein